MNPDKIISESSVTIEDFIKVVATNAPGNPIMGECLTYAVAFNDIFDGNGVFCIYVPDMESAESPMHTTVVIGDDHYDGRGKTSRNRILQEQYDVMRSDYKKYINQNQINNSLYQHLENNTEIIDSKSAKSKPIFSPDKYKQIVKYANDQLNNLDDGLPLDAHKSDQISHF